MCFVLCGEPLISHASSSLAEMTRRYNLKVKNVHSVQLKGKISVHLHGNTAESPEEEVVP